jgi:hypothetical protein
MANAFTNFLGQVFNSPTQLKDYQHASRLYVDDYFRLAPKAGFLYYVVFNINKNSNPIVSQFVEKNGQELGMLVKGIDLPKYKIQTETINQYNRKAIVQSKIDYQPINVKFHDDHYNTTTGLWKAYYNYYYVDGLNNSGLQISPGFEDTKYKKIGANINESTKFGLNNDQTGNFFKSIEIYQLNRKQFTAFILVNPKITDWSHDSLDQTQSKLLENSMTVNFETVIYGTGFVKKDSPSGFATIHYDTTPGALSIFGSGNNSIMGPGGIVPGLNEVLGGAGDTGIGGLLKTARGATNLFNNAKNITKASILSEGYGILDKVARTGKLPDTLTGNSPAGLALAVLPGEQPTAATPRSQGAGGGGFSLGGIASSIAGAAGGLASSISDKLKTLSSGSSGTSKSAIGAAKSEKEQLASDLEDQISKNRGLKDELSVRIANADGDQDAIDAIYAEYDSMGYSDPDVLQASLDSVNISIDELDTLFTEAENAEDPDETLSNETDESELFEDQDTGELFIDSPDIVIAERDVYENNNDEEDDSTTTYFA